MSDDYVYVDPKGNVVNNPNLSYVPQGNAYKQDKGDILDKIRPDYIVEIIRHKLLGERFNNQTNKWEKVPELQKFALSELGAEQIANLMLAVSTQNSSISNLKDAEIKKRVMSIAKTAQYMAIENWLEYGIKRRNQLYFIHEIVFSNSLVVLKQPENEGIRRLIAGTIQESRVYNASQEEKKGGLFGMFKRK